MVPITKIWGSGSKCQNESVPRDLLHAIPILSSFIYQNCLLRVIAVGQSDSPESSHLPAVRKLSTPSDAHAPVGNVDSHVRLKGISVVSDIWSQSFYSTEASFQFNSKIYREACYRGMSPRKLLISQSHETEKLPPYWNSRSQPNEARCSPSLLNENWCLCDLSHGITLRTASYRFT